MKNKLVVLLVVAALLTNSSLLAMAADTADVLDANTTVLTSTAYPTDGPAITETDTTDQLVSGTVATRRDQKSVTATASTSDADKIIDLVNQERADAGIPPLVEDDSMYEAALQRSLESSVSFSHTRPDGSRWDSVDSTVNGENLATGYDTTGAVMDAWMDSPGHRDNILDARFSRISVASIETDDGRIWVQLFGV